MVSRENTHQRITFFKLYSASIEEKILKAFFSFKIYVQCSTVKYYPRLSPNKSRILQTP